MRDTGAGDRRRDVRQDRRQQDATEDVPDRDRGDEHEAVFEAERGRRVPGASTESAKRRQLVSPAPPTEIEGEAERQDSERRCGDAGGVFHPEAEVLRAGCKTRLYRRGTRRDQRLESGLANGGARVREAVRENLERSPGRLLHD